MKAQQEVLDNFNFSETAMGASELLNITEPGAGNTVLLAISAVIQGYRPVSDVSSLLTRMANDLKEDGSIDNPELKSALISHAIYIDPGKTVQNLKNRLTDEGTSVEIPEFGQYLAQFISNTAFIPEALIAYPQESSLGLNILNQDNSEFKTGNQTTYSMAAETLAGIGLKIELKVLEAEENLVWGIRTDHMNWKISAFDTDSRTQTFEVLESGKPADLKISFLRPMQIQIKYIEGNKEQIRNIQVVQS